MALVTAAALALTGASAATAAASTNAAAPGAPIVRPVTVNTFPTKGGILFGGTDGLASQTTALGRNLAIIRVYYKIGAKFPPYLDAKHMSEGSTMLVSLDSNGQSYASIAAGQYDTQISAFLAEVNQAAITYKLSSIYITFQHEPETAKNTALGTAAQFVQAWDHVHQLAANANLDWNQNAGGRLLWALILVRGTYSVGTNAGGYWPGPGEVDIVAADGYNSYGCPSSPNPNQTPAQIFGPTLAFARANGNLPVFLAEWASYAGLPTNQAQYIAEMQSYLAAHHTKIKAAMYWDQGGANCNYAVDGNPGSLTAMATLGASSVMQGTAHMG